MLKIMIVDDHALMRDGLKRIINSSGTMTVAEEAADGMEALAKIKKADFDVMVVDIAMPNMGGIELIRQVRNAKPELPILVVSMHDNAKIAATALKAGANGYITKDINPDTFLMIVANIAFGGRYVDPVIGANLVFEGASKRQPHELLSKRESQILHLLISGKPIKQIAREVFINPRTVSTHKKRIMEKMKIRNNADLMRYPIGLPSSD